MEEASCGELVACIKSESKAEIRPPSRNSEHLGSHRQKSASAICYLSMPMFLLQLGNNDFLPLLPSKSFKKILFIYLFIWEGGDGKKKERERNFNVREKHWSIASHTHPNQGPTHNPDMYPEWESNWWHFALWDDTQPTEPHQSGLGQILSVVELSNEICEVVPKLILSVITNSIRYKFLSASD